MADGDSLGLILGVLDVDVVGISVGVGIDVGIAAVSS